MKEKDISDPDQRYRLDCIIESLRPQKIAVRLNRNRQTLISLRYQKDKSLRLSLHYQFLEDAQVIEDIIKFAQTGGRGRFPRLNHLMNSIYYGHQSPTLESHSENNSPALMDIECIGAEFDFDACYQRIHETYFPDISMPYFGWAKQSAIRELRSIRFGAYHSASCKILLNPRLQQDWIAVVFVEHIFHHELCHHRQFLNPKRREQTHGKRFKQWEQSFPGYELARHWQRARLKQLMAAPQEIKQGFQESFIASP